MNDSGSQDARRSIALVERLLEVEERVHGLVRDNLNLQRDLASGRSHRSTSGAAFDVPRTAHEWRLADDAGLRPDDLDLYDRRCDDEVVLAGRSGALFLEQFNLLGAEPDYAGATAAIQAAAAGLRPPAAARARGKPDVSIVVPAYGQLAYTLNCIHSLVSHGSRYSAEILVIDDASPDRSGEFLRRLPCIRYHLQKANGGFIQSCNAGGKLAAGRFIVQIGRASCRERV